MGLGEEGPGAPEKQVVRFCVSLCLKVSPWAGRRGAAGGWVRRYIQQLWYGGVTRVGNRQLSRITQSAITLSCQMAGETGNRICGSIAATIALLCQHDAKNEVQGMTRSPSESSGPNESHLASGASALPQCLVLHRRSSGPTASPTTG